MKYRILLLMIAGILQFQAYAQKNIRVKDNFDFDWKFMLNDDSEYAIPNLNDTNWETIQLPHDWNIKQNFDVEIGGSAAYLPEGIAWYRKIFTVPDSYNGKIVSILFDGIFHQSDVYINGKHLGYRPYGFCSIEYDLTPYLRINEENTIAVRVNCTGGRPRWYAGSGIYRHAWIQVVNPVHVTTYGTYITTPVVNDEKAEIQITTTLVNRTKEKQIVTVMQRIIDSAGKQVVKSNSKKTELLINETRNFSQELSVIAPELWTLECPVLYTMETTVRVGNKITDIYTTPFGIRTFNFNKDKGFSLNGKSIKLKGMCLHQDAGSLGVAVPDRSYERRLEMLKEYGCNAIRCAHNQPSPEFLDMCDRMGFIVIDEAFDKWKSGYYEQYFDEWWQKDLADMILRDRNHPCIALWSIGNELQEAWDSSEIGVERAKMLQEFVHQLEPTRPVTMAVQNGHQEKFAGITDVIGYNYLEARMLSDRKNHPERVFLISEELPYYRGEEGNIRSYTPLNPWEIVKENDFVAGGFIWSGVDYLGESGWPGKGWPNGLFDICMFEKPRAAYHRAMWNPAPMVSIAVIDQSLNIEHGRDLWQWPKMASHWNFPEQYKGMIMEVRTTTNCESVEMFLNDKSMGKHDTSDFSNNTIVWYIPYTLGKLEAKGYNGGEEVAQAQLVTSGEAAKAIIHLDRTELEADGQDLSHITIHLVDEDGHPVQTDDREVTVTIEGEGKFLGIDNGDLRREESFSGNQLKTYFGKSLIVIQSTLKPGMIQVNITIDRVKESYKETIYSKKNNSN